MTPELLPMLKPFVNAIAAQRERAPMSDREAKKLDGAASLRAWWISGLTKESLAKEAYREATRAIEDGLTKDEFLERLGQVLDKNGGTLLSPQRLELIAQNNTAVAYASGRYAQMRDPDITALRPYWQYPLGPSDGRTSEICRKLEGFVARFDHPAWDHIFPPNHHNERHLQVLTLTEEQAREIGIYEGPEYPKVDGQDQLPDPGWDFKPDLLGADDAAAAGNAVELGTDLVAARDPEHYNLLSLASVDVATLPPMPAASASDWDAFRNVFGIEAGQDGTYYPTPLGSVRINRWLFDKLGEERAWLAPAIKATLDEPFEAWWLYDAEERTELRLIGMFADKEEAKPLLVVAKIGDGGWLSWTAHRDSNRTHLEAKRKGRLLRSKARRPS